MFIPKKVIPGGFDKIFKEVDPIVQKAVEDLMDVGFYFYMVGQVRGKCYEEERVITIPEFLFRTKHKPKYSTWYLAHECAHGLSAIRNHWNTDNHGPKFMAELKIVCPADAIHYEINYKPRNATNAGISAIPFFNTGIIPNDF